jgi:hypothetical protein
MQGIVIVFIEGRHYFYMTIKTNIFFRAAILPIGEEQVERSFNSKQVEGQHVMPGELTSVSR